MAQGGGSWFVYVGIPLGRQSEAFSARGPIDSLIFYRRPTLGPEDFSLIWWKTGGGGGWVATFFVFKILDTNIVFSSDVEVHIRPMNVCRTKVLWVAKYGEVGCWGTEIPNSPNV